MLPVARGAHPMVVMGILNVTPDSFSDGGRWADPEQAIEHGLRLWDEGADLVDVGGESTRPGAERPETNEEIARVVPVVAVLAAEGVAVSVDTMRADVAEKAIWAGASIVNDVSGGLADPRILDVVAASDASFVAMHWRGHSDRMQDLAVYDGPGGVVEAVHDELRDRADAALAAGIDHDRILLDPGLGFAKTAEHNWELLGGLDRLAELGYPLLLGASRKSFLGRLLAGPDGQPRPTDEREYAHTALTVLGARAGAWGTRVHDVRAAVDALTAVAAWEGRLPR